MNGAAARLRPPSTVSPTVLIGVTLGLALGVGAGLAPGMDRGPWVWGAAMAAFGVVLARLGVWVVRQSGDLPKMRTSLLLSGPVLACLTCLALDEPFAPPVVASLLLGAAMGGIIRAVRPRP